MMMVAGSGVGVGAGREAAVLVETVVASAGGVAMTVHTIARLTKVPTKDLRFTGFIETQVLTEWSHDNP